MQEKTLEEEFKDYIVVYETSGKIIEGLPVENLISFISSREEKAREEGRKEGLQTKIEYDKEGWDDELEEVVTQYKEELLNKIDGLLETDENIDGEIFIPSSRRNDALSEVKKIIN